MLRFLALSFQPATVQLFFPKHYQVFGDFEVIVVNDGSADNTSEVLAAIQEKHPAIRVINQENSERGKARNKGWKEAKGEFVVFFDSEDLMPPEYLKELHNIIVTKQPEIICAKIVFQTDRGTIKTHIDQKNLNRFYNFKLFLKGNPIACHFAVKNAFTEFKTFIEDRELASMEDWIFLLENTFDKVVFFIDKPLVTMRLHSGQSMKQDYIIAERKL